MREHMRQKLGVAAAGALPGLTFDPQGYLTFAWGALSAVALFLSGQLIWTSPRSPRMGIALLPLGLIGVAQDLLVWCLLIWFTPVAVDGFWWAPAAAALSRTGACLGLWLLPRDRAEAAAA
ncbi:hypothetical protein [Streptomyces sp. NPDC002640]